jgi:flagellar protein FlbD
MIPLHRITHPGETFWLNPSHVQTVEATPDTVVSLTNGSRFVVGETPHDIARLVRDWKAGVLGQALAATPDASREAVAGASAEILRFRPPGR